jgi:hypothetical protein
MINSSSLKEKLLILCQKIYRPKISKESVNFGKDITNIIEFTKRNRLAHFLALEYSQLFKNDKKRNDTCQSLIAEYNEYERKVKNSIKKIKQVLKGKEFMIVKTFSRFPHLTNDVDVLAKDLKDETFPLHIENQDLWPIHIENKISWMGADAVSNDFAWHNTQRFVFEGLDFLVPNPQLDTIIRLGHIPFEVAHIKLGELLHIYSQASQFDWKFLEDEAELMEWSKTFKKMSGILELLHQVLFKKPFLRKSKTSISSKRKIEFPFELPFSVLAGGVIEKKAWEKIYGARFVIRERINSWIRRNIH